MFRPLIRVLALLFMITQFHGAIAQSMTDTERKVVWDAASAASVNGPTDVPISDQAILHLPSDMVFVPAQEGGAIMRMWGNSVGEGFHGLLFPKDENKNWFISIDHTADGYVKDDDAKTWSPDDLLQSLKDGTEIQNEERIAMGIPAMDIVGWVQSPSYDEIKHRLIWSLRSVDRGAEPGAPGTINYNTYALGRDGYFEIDLITSDKTIEADKAAAHTALASLEYKQGKRYSDYDASTDRIAEYGLVALVGGVAAKKLGLFALAAAFFAKFAKLILLGGAALVGGLFKLFRRNTNDA